MEIKVNIREIRLEDIPDIIHVANQAFLEDARRPSVSGSILVHGLSRFPKLQLLAEVNGEVAGFILGELRDSRGKIMLLAVSPKYWRKGIGRRLVEELEKRIKEMGGKELTLGTPFARGFYEKVGFTCYSIEYKLTKEIPYSVIPEMKSNLNPISLNDLRSIVKKMPSDEALTFLRAYFNSFEAKGGRAYKLVEEGEIKGVVVVAENRWNSELLEIKYIYPSSNELVITLAENLVIEASKMGYRWVGICTYSKEVANSLIRKGWKEAHMAEFWTMYLMKKEL